MKKILAIMLLCGCALGQWANNNRVLFATIVALVAMIIWMLNK